MVKKEEAKNTKKNESRGKLKHFAAIGEICNNASLA